jgi:hypothetical protein
MEYDIYALFLKNWISSAHKFIVSSFLILISIYCKFIYLNGGTIVNQVSLPLKRSRSMTQNNRTSSEPMSDIDEHRPPSSSSSLWDGKDTENYNPDLIKRIYTTLSPSNIKSLELNRYLEKYLWVHFNVNQSSHEHLMSILCMVNEKFRENIKAWGKFNPSHRLYYKPSNNHHPHQTRLFPR